MAEFVATEHHDTVALLVVDAPHRNALSPALTTEIAEAIAAAERDQAITAIVIASGGASFCSGADLNLLRQIAPDPLEPDAYDALGTIYALFEAMQSCSLPTLAAVNGGIVGAGINLALVCDVRIVSDDVEVAGFGRAGVHPGGGHLSLLAQRIDRGAAAGVALFGQTLGAADAVRTGFASARVPVGKLRQKAIEVASGAGSDKALVQAVVRSFRAATSAQLAPAAAVQLERAPQVWSLRRRFLVTR